LIVSLCSPPWSLSSCLSLPSSQDYGYGHCFVFFFFPSSFIKWCGVCVCVYVCVCVCYKKSNIVRKAMNLLFLSLQYLIVLRVLVYLVLRKCIYK
jgi:hypothetical protein